MEGIVSEYRQFRRRVRNRFTSGTHQWCLVASQLQKNVSILLIYLLNPQIEFQFWCRLSLTRPAHDIYPRIGLSRVKLKYIFCKWCNFIWQLNFQFSGQCMISWEQMNWWGIAQCTTVCTYTRNFECFYWISFSLYNFLCFRSISWETKKFLF